MIFFDVYGVVVQYVFTITFLGYGAAILIALFFIVRSKLGYGSDTLFKGEKVVALSDLAPGESGEVKVKLKDGTVFEAKAKNASEQMIKKNGEAVISGFKRNAYLVSILPKNKKGLEKDTPVPVE